MLILLWGLPNDPVLRVLGGHLARIGAPSILLDQRRAPDSALHLELDPALGGVVTVDDQRIDLGAVSAVYPRPYDTRRLPPVARAGDSSSTWAAALAFDQAVLTWLEATPALVINRPSAMAINGSKTAPAHPAPPGRLQDTGDARHHRPCRGHGVLAPPRAGNSQVDQWSPQQGRAPRFTACRAARRRGLVSDPVPALRPRQGVSRSRRRPDDLRLRGDLGR
jgi:hypothetical protein